MSPRKGPAMIRSPIRIRLLAADIVMGWAMLTGLGCRVVERNEPDRPALTATKNHQRLRTCPTAEAANREAARGLVQQPAEATIDLGVALRLAGVDNPTINLARERVREAVAGQLAARALLLPSVNVGGNFYLHRGALQSGSGAIREGGRQRTYLGF